MDVRSAFKEQTSKTADLQVRAPGRVNLLGEHVDYNGGPVLPAAIDRQVTIAAARLPGDVVELYALDLGKQAAFRLSELDLKVDVNGDALPNWALYPAGVAWALKEAGLQVGGVQAAYTSNVPIGAGLSSSAAVEVGFAVLWQALGGWQIDRLALAQLCQRAENVYAGVASGLMDQFASANGVAGHALYFDTQSLAWEAVPLPPDSAIVIADSGVRRSLQTSAYNERRSACEQATAILREKAMPGIRSLRDVSPTELAAYSELLPPSILPRAEHVVHEIVRVQTAVSALKRGEARSFGALMFAGHASLRDRYQVSTPELDALVQTARQGPGCYGARLTGAGFGGCTVNLVESAAAEAFMAHLSEGYTQATGRTAQVYLCKASDGAGVIDG